MAWQVSCSCGLTFEAQAMDLCPRCQMPVPYPRTLGTVDAWLQQIRDEIGLTTDGEW